ncbi:hypothetical protein ACFLUZ_07445, partial [Chloroflexota bacterium]
TGNNVFQLVTLIIYITLTLVILRYGRSYGRNRLKNPFLFFLMLSVGWSFVSFISNIPFQHDLAMSWGKFISVFASAATIAYLYFIAVYVGRKTAAARIAKLGTGYIIFLTVLAILGHIPQGYTIMDSGIVYKDYGWTLLFIAPVGFSCLLTSVFFLVQTLRNSRDPDYRNRITFL